MEGAGGVVAANYLEKRVPPDGLTLALPGRSWFVEGLVKSPGVTFDPTRFSFIGSSGVAPAFLFVRADSGIKTFEDLKRSTKPLPLAAIAAGTSTAMVPRLLAQIGVPVEAVLGYGSTPRRLAARGRPHPAAATPPRRRRPALAARRGTAIAPGSPGPDDRPR